MRGMPRARMASAVFLVVALVIVAGTAGVATGLPLPPLFPALPPVAGESHLTSYIVGPASSVSVDWMVLPAAFLGGAPILPVFGGGLAAAPAGSFVYYYQVENATGSALDTFTITMPTASILFGGSSRVITLTCQHSSTLGMRPPARWNLLLGSCQQ